MTSIGTYIFTLLNGKIVGKDRFGNSYYTEKKQSDKTRARRWVIYNGLAEPSKIPAEWHFWLHYTSDSPLSEREKDRYFWQKEHIPNTNHSYKRVKNKQKKSKLNYTPWIPKK